MQRLTLEELEERLSGHLYRENIIRSIKSVIGAADPLAVILTGELTAENPSAVAGAELVLLYGKARCFVSLSRGISRSDEFGLLDVSFMDLTTLMGKVKDRDPQALGLLEKGLVIYTKKDDVWREVAEMLSFLAAGKEGRV